jgi:hypothetical protein
LHKLRRRQSRLCQKLALPPKDFTGAACKKVSIVMFRAGRAWPTPERGKALGVDLFFSDHLGISIPEIVAVAD